MNKYIRCHYFKYARSNDIFDLVEVLRWLLTTY